MSRLRPPASDRRSRYGLTLLELLVVIFIISIMLAIAIPALKPNVEQSALRESARMVNSAMATARTRAQRTGRPYGVMFSSLAGNPRASIVLHYVQVPPPYAGDTIGSRMAIRSITDNADGTETWVLTMFSSDLLAVDSDGDGDFSNEADDNVQPGDVLKLNFQGPGYEIVSVTDRGDTNDKTWGLRVVSRPGLRPATVPSTNNPKHAFQFFRRPRKSSATPIPLPASVAIDLSMSGTDLGNFAPVAGNPIAITFSPTGRVDRLFHPGRPGGERLLSPVHFLIGKTGRYGMENVLDLDSIWVSVGYQTGVVTSTENACVDSNGDGNCDEFQTTTSYTAGEIVAAINQARVFARSGHGMGG